MGIFTFLFICFVVWLLMNKAEATDQKDFKSLLKKKSFRVAILLSAFWLIVSIIFTEMSTGFLDFFDITWSGRFTSRERETLLFILIPIIFIISYGLWFEYIKKIIAWVKAGE